ncbi:tetratricopeptide repeat protein [Frankia tisae]|uniref:tetratricopeptide repeat protein n=1 Tax=Frankia tisae TaxID=2950104 RepID=UPI0021C240AB|nr:tetratricopeptide repeat protein [Frankia tisae]
MKREVLVEAGHRCAIPTCKATTTEIAHIVPWEKVREHTFENLIALCPNCHTRFDKGDIDRRSMQQYKANLSGIVDLGKIRAPGDPLRGLYRVRDANPRSLGVHAAIDVPGAVGELPRYVPRDIDVRLRSAVRIGSGFLLLIGSSSVGKTRCAYEALLAEHPDWLLFHPPDLAHLDAFAAAPTSHTVVWLDELQRYLAAGLNSSTVRALRNVRQPILIVGTLWPDAYHTFGTPPPLDAHDDPFFRQRDVLGLATVMVVSPVLSTAELDHAVLAAATDPRLAATLNSSYGMTQALSAAPELIHRWEAAPNRHTWALIAAATDARRVGVRSPLSADLLRASIPGYLTPTERAKAPINWFETALSYATTELHGAASVLAPVAEEMGAPTGYSVADYVYQHALQTRRSAVPPETAWIAYVEHLSDSADRLAVADSAEDRKLYHQAERLYRSVGPVALPSLALLQFKAGRNSEAEDSWRAAITAIDDPNSRIWLAGRLADRDRFDEAEQLLREAIAAGLVDGRSRLGSLLEKLGRLDEAEQVFREGVAGIDPDAWFGLAEVLKKQGRIDEAENVLREAIATGGFDESAGGGGGPRYWLTVLLRDQGRCEDAERVCRDGVAAGVPESRY